MAQVTVANLTEGAAMLENGISLVRVAGGWGGGCREGGGGLRGVWAGGWGVVRAYTFGKV